MHERSHLARLLNLRSVDLILYYVLVVVSCSLFTFTFSSLNQEYSRKCGFMLTNAVHIQDCTGRRVNFTRRSLFIYLFNLLRNAHRIRRWSTLFCHWTKKVLSTRGE
jgi:hypothetical protein